MCCGAGGVSVLLPPQWNAKQDASRSLKDNLRCVHHLHKGIGCRGQTLFEAEEDYDDAHAVRSASPEHPFARQWRRRVWALPRSCIHTGLAAAPNSSLQSQSDHLCPLAASARVRVQGTRASRFVGLGFALQVAEGTFFCIVPSPEPWRCWLTCCDGRPRTKRKEQGPKE